MPLGAVHPNERPARIMIMSEPEARGPEDDERRSKDHLSFSATNLAISRLPGSFMCHRP